MAFGAKITDFSQAAIGSYGYTIKVSVLNDLIVSIDAVQVQAAADSTPAPVVGETAITDLLGYLNSVSAPDLAYNFSEGEVTIFLLTDTFPYEDTTRFALFGNRKGQNVSDLTDKIDIPDKDINYLINLCLELSYLIKKKYVPRDIVENIRLEELRISDEV